MKDYPCFSIWGGWYNNITKYDKKVVIFENCKGVIPVGYFAANACKDEVEEL